MIRSQTTEAVLLSVKTNWRSLAGLLSLPNMVVKDVPDHDLLQIKNKRFKDKHFTIFFDRVQFSLFALIITLRFSEAKLRNVTIARFISNTHTRTIFLSLSPFHSNTHTHTCIHTQTHTGLKGKLNCTKMVWIIFTNNHIFPAIYSYNLSSKSYSKTEVAKQLWSYSPYGPCIAIRTCRPLWHQSVVTKPLGRDVIYGQYLLLFQTKIQQCPFFPTTDTFNINFIS